MKANMGKIALVTGVAASVALFALRRYAFKGKFSRAMSIFSGIALVTTGLTRGYTFYRMLKANTQRELSEAVSSKPRRRRTTSRRRSATRRKVATA